MSDFEMGKFHQKLIELVKRARCAERNFRVPVGPHAHTEWRLFRQERRVIFCVAALEAQRDAAVDACRAFVEAWEKSCQLEKTDVALRMARAVIGAEAQSGFMEDGARWPAEARKEGVVYDSDHP